MFLLKSLWCNNKELTSLTSATPNQSVTYFWTCFFTTYDRKKMGSIFFNRKTYGVKQIVIAMNNTSTSKVISKG